MPSQPQAGRGSQASSTKGKASTSAAKSPPRQTPPADSDTGTSDHVYGVVSVLYHALQGADTYLQYIEDARNAGDDELTSFFEQCREEEQRRAARAKALLASRLGGDIDEDEDDDDEDEDDDDEDEDDDDEA